MDLVSNCFVLNVHLSLRIFSLSSEYVVLAESYSNYYWTIDKSKISRCNLFYSIMVAIYYHPGSIAFGSFILATIQFVYYIVQCIYNQIHRNDLNPTTTARTANAAVTTFVPGASLVTNLWSEVSSCNWAAYYLKLLEIVVRLINTNVYIIIAITGTNYCQAAHEGFHLLIANPVRTLVLTGVAQFFFFLNRVIISVIVGALAYAVFDNRFAPFIYFDNLYAVWFLVLVS